MLIIASFLKPNGIAAGAIASALVQKFVKIVRGYFPRTNIIIGSRNPQTPV